MKGNIAVASGQFLRTNYIRVSLAGVEVKSVIYREGQQHILSKENRVEVRRTAVWTVEEHHRYLGR